jgi:hypothetical protein
LFANKVKLLITVDVIPDAVVAESPSPHDVRQTPGRDPSHRLLADLCRGHDSGCARRAPHAVAVLVVVGPPDDLADLVPVLAEEVLGRLGDVLAKGDNGVLDGFSNVLDSFGKGAETVGHGVFHLPEAG